MSTKHLVPKDLEDQPVEYLRRSPEEVARLAHGREPFDYDAWARNAPPATPEELAETEEFLRLRALERQASIAAEAGLSPSPVSDADGPRESVG
jgi:hypothetical protein